MYQIYPRSFADSDGDGVGDLRGITERVDYLADLGIDLVWLCPVYDSPMADNGYDIRDYRAIDDAFGTMADWEALRDALHDRDIRLIMDLVVNHTSREHDWFQRSRRGDDDYADFYHWVDGDPETPPNNWESIFGGPAWSYDDEREAWYLHLFDPAQPDLNWRNPAVRDAVTDVVTWWLDEGIDGFRLDAIDHLSKREGYPDGDPEAPITGLEHFSHGPHLDDYLDELCAAFDGYDATTVGEMGGADIEDVDDYTGEDGLDMVFQFDHTDVDIGSDGRWDPESFGEWDLPELKSVVSRQQSEIEWPALFLGNHDQPRLVSRFGDEAYRRESATLIATFLLTMRGTPFVYQGEELGMTNAVFESLDEIDDPMTVGAVEGLVETGAADGFDDVADLVNYQSRDHARTPMQWAAEENAGFTTGEPWLAVTDDYPAVNAAAQRGDPNSVWNHYRELIALRHERETLVYGDYTLYLPDHERLYVYTRSLADETLLVVLNWSAETAVFDAPLDAAGASRLHANYRDAPDDPDGARLRPYEAALYRL